MRSGTLGLATVHVLACATLMAQGQPFDAAQAKPQFRSGVELIQLDVAVLDDKRLPVRGLRAEDFTVLDNGAPTPIRAFTPVELPTRVRTTDAVWANDVSPDVVTNQVGEQEGRLVIILMDRSTPAEQPTQTARKIATAAVDALGPNDLAAVISTSNNAVQDRRVQNFTADRGLLLRAINAADPSMQISGEDGKRIWMMIFGAPPDPFGAPSCLCGLCVLETITRVADAVQHTARRRKLLLFIGNTVIFQSSDATGDGRLLGCNVRLKDTRTAMFAALDRANLTVHSIDPGGVVTVGPQTHASTPNGERISPARRLQMQRDETTEVLGGQEALKVLPSRTGGRTVLNRNDPERSVPEIFRESDVYYVLAIERAASARPDRGHSIEVKVARKGAHVYSQRQYLEMSDAKAAATYGPPASAEEALRRLMPSASLPLSLGVTTFASPDSEKAIVRVNIDAAAFAHADGTAVPLDIMVQAVDRVGRQVALAKQQSTIAVERVTGRSPDVVVQSQLELPHGDYGIRAAVADPLTGRIASVFSDVTVPEFESAALSLSDVIIESARGPITRRTFRRSDQVRAVLQIYQGTKRTDPIAPVTMRVRIVDDKGAAVRDQSLPFAPQAFTNRRADCVITLPLANLQPGDYLLKLEAAKEQRSAARALRFVVER